MIIVGPPGSGKTHFVLEKVAATLREGRAGKVLLVTPTASMARHLAHDLARRSLAVPGGLVVPISKVFEMLTPDRKEPTAVIDSWLIERALEQSAGNAFGELSRSPGLQRRAKAAIDELQTAGYNPAQARRFAATTLQHGLAAAYDAYQSFLDSHELSSAPQRRIEAAQAAALVGIEGKRELYFDGFWSFSPVERDLILSLRNRGANVTVTATPDMVGQFRDWPRTALKGTRKRTPQRVVVKAPRVDQEVEEIALRILAANRPWREMGVLLRTPSTYGSVIEATFTRFGIPYRLNIAQPLSKHSAGALVSEMLAAITRGLPGEDVLQALRRPVSRLSQSTRSDAYDFALQERLPGRGLEFLLAGAPAEIREALAGLDGVEAWMRKQSTPDEWATRVKALVTKLLARPTAADRLTAPEVLEIRDGERAVEGVLQCVEGAAEFFDFRGRLQVRFKEFVDSFERFLAHATLQATDDRRNVVNVLPVHEARQWELPVVFVCGMVEGQFPAELAEDLFFPEAERVRLRKLGVRLRGRDERRAEEQLLFAIAESRASEELVLSYPELTATGAPLMRSFYLPEASDEEPKAQPVRPRETPSDGPTQGRSHLTEAAAIATVQAKHLKFGPSGLERFLRCPYEFFAGYTLRLRERPGSVEERLDARQCGSVIHAVLESWGADSSQPIAEILSDVFASKLAELNLQQGFRTAMVEDALRRDLERFVGERIAQPLPGSQPGGFEKTVGYVMEQGPQGEVWVNGKLDRYDAVGDGMALVIDYKHSSADTLKKLVSQHQDGTKFQGPLYLTGLREQLKLEPAGMIFCSLKDNVTTGGWVRSGVISNDELPDRVEAVTADELGIIIARGVEAAADAGKRIRGGEIAVAPTDEKHCSSYCSFGGVCRVRS